jgi:DNA-binding transcriptional ArsR family regulator
MAAASALRNLAAGFGQLSDPTRLGILKMLSAGPKSVTALCDGLGIKQPMASHHLGLLRIGRMVVGTRKGKSVVYTADAESLKELAAAIAKLMPRR